MNGSDLYTPFVLKERKGDMIAAAIEGLSSDGFARREAICISALIGDPSAPGFEIEEFLSQRLLEDVATTLANEIGYVVSSDDTSYGGQQVTYREDMSKLPENDPSVRTNLGKIRFKKPRFHGPSFVREALKESEELKEAYAAAVVAELGKIDRQYDKPVSDEGERPRPGL